MRRFALCLTAICIAWFCSLSLLAQTISAAEASKHIGEKETVCGTIASEHTASNSRGTPTFINLDKAYPNQVFTLLIWGDDRASVGELPTSGRICATGTITEYRGSPEIVLRDAKSWSVPK
jgi:hypothetical protein